MIYVITHINSSRITIDSNKSLRVISRIKKIDDVNYKRLERIVDDFEIISTIILKELVSVLK